MTRHEQWVERLKTERDYLKRDLATARKALGEAADVMQLASEHLQDDHGNAKLADELRRGATALRTLRFITRSAK